ncbi:ComEA family DNA-binding protein [Candidatus Dojkabacteria bacterium]|uniref:ComEA family DNA-binding protein n=1 Tax=Candidatus Dojkabacteria bacterium TaxID=2099670 RepID=A0A847VD55_9BACT|nr:ComEA family DNA-binding protein [Candidatus Dojkabacteria bacterium]
MEKSVSFKNIAYLSLFFVLGFLSHLYLIHREDIDLFSILNQQEDVTVIEDVVEKMETECSMTVEQEEEYNPCPVLIDVSGAVKNPGVYCFQRDNSVMDAIKKAKGFTSDAGFKYISMKINLATKLIGNTKIYIPFESDYDCKLLTFNLPKEIIEISTPPAEKAPEDTTGTPAECISINNATSEELQTLSGIGPSTAEKIIEGRPYEVLEDLLNVKGIGEATFNKFKDKICL